MTERIPDIIVREHDGVLIRYVRVDGLSDERVQELIATLRKPEDALTVGLEGYGNWY